ncbi:50S ribosomal protein L24 [Patescibacteria group bacterium]|nr:50S ribosomal protein L24 [Patescibacteria group bacterium]
MKFKVGDSVKVMVGKDKGKIGKIMQVFPDMNLVVVEGVRASTRHLKPRGEKKQGERVTYNAPLRAENVSLTLPSGATGRVGYKITGDKKIRVLRSKKSVEEVG